MKHKNIFQFQKKNLLHIAIIALIVFLSYRAYRAYRNYLFSDFTEEEYAEIVGKDRLTKNGILPETERFLEEDKRLHSMLGKFPKGEARRIKIGLLKLSQAEQRKLEDPRNAKLLDELADYEDRISECLTFKSKDTDAIEIINIQSYTGEATTSFKRHLAILKADQHYGFKLFSTPKVDKYECNRLLDSKGQ